MIQLRTHGRPPFGVAVVHGGPGAGGEMAPVARELASCQGVLEPIQTATSLHGQVEELRQVLETRGDPPVTLIGFSWGAWLSFITAARYFLLVRKLILVASGPFDEQYVAALQETRRSRLSQAERAEFEATLRGLNDPTVAARNTLLARLGTLTGKADTYDPIPGEAMPSDLVGPRADIFESVWGEAARMRRSGELLDLGGQIRCPVVAIHGDYDPHPAEGVEKPLTSVLGCFRFILLENCGHRPWIERQARRAFYRVLEEELD
ncbi:MAG: alpha/beta hydrolase [Anaerolineae bacterium]